MRYARHVVGLLVILAAVPVARGADTKPAEELAALKNDLKKAWGTLNEAERPGATEAEKKVIVDRYGKTTTELARRALALAETYTGAPEAPESLAWIHTGGLGYPPEMEPIRDAAYDLMIQRYLDRDAILPVVRTAWATVPAKTSRAEAFLRAAVERSTNQKVQALACLSLGRYLHNLVTMAREFEHPTRGKMMRDFFGPEKVRRLREVKPAGLNREAEALFERTIREFGSLQPMGKNYPPLGEQARGDLFRLQHLEPGCIVPEVEGEDLDGKPMKLSGLRGKVVVISFWAGWCGPCMSMVPQEKALVVRMKGRPFVLVGVNGDPDRSTAKQVSAKAGINWRSFWDGGRTEGTAVEWSVLGWPTVYVVDAKGVIRDGGVGLRVSDLDNAVEELVAEAEAAAKTR